MEGIWFPSGYSPQVPPWWAGCLEQRTINQIAKGSSLVPALHRHPEEATHSSSCLPPKSYGPRAMTKDGSPATAYSFLRRLCCPGLQKLPRTRSHGATTDLLTVPIKTEQEETHKLWVTYLYILSAGESVQEDDHGNHTVKVLGNNHTVRQSLRLNGVLASKENPSS